MSGTFRIRITLLRQGTDLFVKLTKSAIINDIKYLFNKESVMSTSKKTRDATKIRQKT